MALQECYEGLGGGLRSELVARATKAGFFHAIWDEDPGVLSMRGFDCGLVIISRFPIIARSFAAFEYGDGAENIPMRGVLYAKI